MSVWYNSGVYQQISWPWGHRLPQAQSSHKSSLSEPFTSSIFTVVECRTQVHRAQIVHLLGRTNIHRNEQYCFVESNATGFTMRRVNFAAQTHRWQMISSRAEDEMQDFSQQNKQTKTKLRPTKHLCDYKRARRLNVVFPNKNFFSIGSRWEQTRVNDAQSVCCASTLCYSCTADPSS